MPDKTHCIVCNNTVALNEATPGALYANGQQAFACTKHMASLDWSIAWAMFSHEQESQKSNGLC